MNIAAKVAREFITRAKTQRMTKGVKRDKAALEYCCGAGTAIALLGRVELKADQHALELLAFMVATRGYVYLEEIVAKEGEA